MIHSFKFQNTNVLLDVESGAIHAVDDAAFAVVQAMERGVNPYGVGVDAETVREVLSDLDELKTSGAFETETPTAPEVLGGRDLRAGGTWLAFARSGRFGLVTNFRDANGAPPGAPSRGELVPAFLRGTQPAAGFLSGLLPGTGACWPDYRRKRLTMLFSSTARRDSSWLEALVWLAPVADCVARSRIL